MKSIIIFLSLLLFSFTISAEEKKISDPFDLSKSKSQVDELGIVTKTEVDSLEGKIKELYSSFCFWFHLVRSVWVV